MAERIARTTSGPASAPNGVDFWWVDWQSGPYSRTPGLDPLWALNERHFAELATTGRRPLVFSRYAGPGSHRTPIGFYGDTGNTGIGRPSP